MVICKLSVNYGKPALVVICKLSVNYGKPALVVICKLSVNYSKSGHTYIYIYIYSLLPPQDYVPHAKAFGNNYVS